MLLVEKTLFEVISANHKEVLKISVIIKSKNKFVEYICISNDHSKKPYKRFQGVA